MRAHIIILIMIVWSTVYTTTILPYFERKTILHHIIIIFTQFLKSHWIWTLSEQNKNLKFTDLQIGKIATTLSNALLFEKI